MPKISAPTVAQHRQQVLAALVDATEELMRAHQPVTAAAVSKAAGIVRNSIYRHVRSVDHLQGLVLERHLPGWLSAVSAELNATTDPAERIEVWLSANLTQAATTGHGWMLGMARGLTPGSTTQELMDQAHLVMRASLIEAWQAVTTPDRAAAAAAMTRGLIDVGFRQLDQGVDLELVITTGRAAVRGMVAAQREGNNFH